ncbi:MAG: class I SAM-dependent methyltransferase [Planctomycetes bacterium]|nr:class I SAM-dependent methyltransferase [Planctomycetota bacterium]
MSIIIKKNKAAKAKKNQQGVKEDRHNLYAASVQCPEADVEFFKKTFKSHTGRPLRSIREDFCGTAALCAEWVKDHEHNHALGVDIDRPTLTWGRENIFPYLTEDEQSRIELKCEDVRKVIDPKVELLCAQNFSYWIFTEREEMLRYFQTARQSITDDGLFVMDLMGGTESTEVDVQTRKITDGVRPDGSKIPAFSYLWDQNSYNPITGKMSCYIHFKMRGGKKMNRAFEYHWRVWTLPEINELLLEAGFKGVDVYTEGWDDETDETDGVFRMRKDFDHEGSWIAYVVAKP